MMQSLADGIEQFMDDRAKEFEAWVDEVIEATDEWFDELETAIAPDLDQAINEVLDPLLELLWGLEEQVEDSAQPLVNTVEPMLNNHPACVGCRHYHGQAYNDVMLVCGMHPYGWEGEKCPDWESFWPDAPPDSEI